MKIWRYTSLICLILSAVAVAITVDTSYLSRGTQVYLDLSRFQYYGNSLGKTLSYQFDEEAARLLTEAEVHAIIATEALDKYETMWNPLVKYYLLEGIEKELEQAYKLADEAHLILLAKPLPLPRQTPTPQPTQEPEPWLPVFPDSTPRLTIGTSESSSHPL